MKEMARSKAPRPKRPPVTPEEQAEFLAALGGVTPLGARDRLPIPPPPPSPVKRAVLPPTQALAVESDGARFAARGPGVSHAQIAALKSGKVRAEQTLDLHGDRVDAAIPKLHDFLATALRTGWRCVLVIHGKGLHSDHGAPMREAVTSELLGPASGFVHAMASAPPADGGEGATIVLLRGGK